MTAILHTESKGHVRASLLLGASLVGITAVFVGLFPAMSDEVDVILEAYPDYLIDALDLEALHTIEGFAAGYIYPFVVVLFGGVYIAYVSGGLIAADIESRKMDLTLSNPVSRESVLIQKVLALWVPILAIHGGVGLTMVGGSILVGEPIDIVRLLIMHLFLTPYLLVCAGIGLLFSVVANGDMTARAGGLVVVFMLWLVETIVQIEETYEWLGVITPSYYITPLEILVDGEYPFLDASILLLAFLVLVTGAIVHFRRRDI